MKAKGNEKYPENVVMLVFLQLKMNQYGGDIFHGNIVQSFEKQYTKTGKLFSPLNQETTQLDFNAGYLILIYVKTKRI